MKIKNTYPVLVLFLTVLFSPSCSRNPSDYGVGPKQPVVGPTEPPPTEPPPPTQPPPPVQYPKPGERKLDCLVALDISEESKDWLPKQVDYLTSWFQALQKQGHDLQVAFVNSAQRNDGSYDFSILGGSQGVFTPKTTFSGMENLVLNPQNMGKGKALQFYSIEFAATMEENNFFFRKDSEMIYYSFASFAEFQTPKPSLTNALVQKLMNAMSRGSHSWEHVHFLPFVRQGSVSMLSDVMGLISSPSLFGFASGQNKDFLPKHIKKIFGPDCSPEY